MGQRGRPILFDFAGDFGLMEPGLCDPSDGLGLLKEAKKVPGDDYTRKRDGGRVRKQTCCILSSS